MNSERKRGIRPFWFVLALLLGIPIILCSGAGLWWFGRTSVAQKKLDQKKEELLARGLPFDNATLADYYVSLTDDLYTGSWLAVIKTIQSVPFREQTKALPIFSDKLIPAPDQPWPEQVAVAKLLNDYRGTLETLHQITDSDQSVRFPRNVDSNSTSLNEVQAMREVSRLLSIEHQYALRTGNAELEYEAIDSPLGTSIALRADPLFVSQLTSIATHGMAIKAIQESVNRGLMDDQHLASIDQRLRQFDDFRAPLRISIAGERALGLPVFEEPGSYSDPYGPDLSALGALGPRPLDALYFLEIFDAFETSNSTDLDAFAVDTQEASKQLDEIFESRGRLKTMDTILTGLLRPAFEQMGYAWLHQAITNKLAKTEITIRRYKNQRGEFPGSLADLEQLDFDPNDAKVFSGETLGYRIIDGTATLWSYDHEDQIQLGPASCIGTEPPVLKSLDKYGNGAQRWEFQ